MSMALRKTVVESSIRGLSEGQPSPPSALRSSSFQCRSPIRPSSASAASTATVSAPPAVPLKLATPPIIHTTAYLQQTQQLAVAQLPVGFHDDDDEQQQVDLSSNALVWALKKVDDQLNHVEQQPNELHQKLYNFTNGPVGQATSKGVQSAAKLTMTATIEVAKAAAPVGKWALQQGFKAAVGLVGAAMEQEQKQKQKQKQQGKGGK